MNAFLVFGAVALIGGLIGVLMIRAAGRSSAVRIGAVLSVVGVALAVRQYWRAQAAPDGWTGIAEALGAAFIILAMIGYWGAILLTALKNRRNE